MVRSTRGGQKPDHVGGGNNVGRRNQGGEDGDRTGENEDKGIMRKRERMGREIVGGEGGLTTGAMRGLTMRGGRGGKRKKQCPDELVVVGRR